MTEQVLDDLRAAYARARVQYGKKSAEALEVLLEASGADDESCRDWGLRELRSGKGSIGLDDPEGTMRVLDEALESERPTRAVAAAQQLWPLYGKAKSGPSAMLLERIERAWRDPRLEVACSALEGRGWGGLTSVSKRQVKPSLLEALAALMKRELSPERAGLACSVARTLARADKNALILRPGLVQLLAHADAAVRVKAVAALASELSYGWGSVAVEAVKLRDVPELDGALLPHLASLDDDARARLLSRTPTHPSDLGRLFERCANLKTPEDLAAACARALNTSTEAQRSAALQAVPSYFNSYSGSGELFVQVMVATLDAAHPAHPEGAIGLIELLGMPDLPSWSYGKERYHALLKALRAEGSEPGAQVHAALGRLAERLQRAERFAEAQRLQSVGRTLLPAFETQPGPSVEAALQGRPQAPRGGLTGRALVYSYSDTLGGRISFSEDTAHWTSTGSSLRGVSFEASYSARELRPELWLIWLALPSGEALALTLDLAARLLWSAGGSAEVCYFDEAAVTSIEQEPR